MTKFIFIFLTLFFLSSASAQSYIIGDSQTFFLSKNTQYANIYPNLAKSGIGLMELNQMLDNILPDTSVQNIFISIGVNDSYNDKGIKNFTRNLYSKFPNAYFFIIKGSFGWGNVPNISSSNLKFINYYKTFSHNGVFPINGNIGNGDPHSQKIQYQILGKKIDCIILKSYGEKCTYK